MTSGARGGAFFRTLVLMGSSVALSCGGVTEATGTGGSPGSGGGPSGGGNGTGGGSGGSGTGSGGTGGGALTLGSGGGIIILDPGTGGWDGWNGYGGAFPTDCPTTQLSCSPQSVSNCSVQGFGFFVLPGNCECDSDLPASAEDCDAGEDFVCLGAAEDAAGRRFDPPIPYACACVPGLEGTACSEHCPATAEVCSNPGELSEDLEAFLCGCALTILK